MPLHVIITTPAEQLTLAHQEAHKLSERILQLSDLTKEPLTPGESPDARRHQIAKLGKQLAEAFLVIHEIIQAVGAQAQAQRENDVTAGASDPDKPDNPGAN